MGSLFPNESTFGPIPVSDDILNKNINIEIGRNEGGTITDIALSDRTIPALIKGLKRAKEVSNQMLTKYVLEDTVDSKAPKAEKDDGDEEEPEEEPSSPKVQRMHQKCDCTYYNNPVNPCN